MDSPDHVGVQSGKLAEGSIKRSAVNGKEELGQEIGVLPEIKKDAADVGSVL